MNVKLKPMILVFRQEGDKWQRQVKDLQGKIIHESNLEPLFPEYDEDYFTAWEKQIKKLPFFNIVDCERFK